MFIDREVESKGVSPSSILYRRQWADPWLSLDQLDSIDREKGALGCFLLPFPASFVPVLLLLSCVNIRNVDC